MPLLKNYLLLASSSLALIISTVATAAYYPPAEPQPMPSHFWYIGGTGGVTISSDTTLNGVTTKYQTANWDAGFELGLEYRSWRFEAEYLFQPENINKLNGITDNGGHLRVQTALFNVIYDFLDPGDVYRPYIGVGAGYAFVRYPAVDIVDDNTGVTIVSYPARPSNSVFGYQAQAGVRFAVYDNASFTLGYRYFGTTNADDAIGGRFQNSLINAGFIYFID